METLENMAGKYWKHGWKTNQKILETWENMRTYLVGAFHKLEFYFPSMGIILPIDEVIFFKMVKTTNQILGKLHVRLKSDSETSCN